MSGPKIHWNSWLIYFADTMFSGQAVMARSGGTVYRAADTYALYTKVLKEIEQRGDEDVAIFYMDEEGHTVKLSPADLRDYIAEEDRQKS